MSRRQREGFLIFHDTLELLAELDADDFKAVLLAVGNLSKSISQGEEPEEVKFKGLSKVAYGYLKDGVMYSNRKYQRSSAFNRAKRLGISEPQKKSIKELAGHGFSTVDIAIFKDADEEEIQEILSRNEPEAARTSAENIKIKNLVKDLLDGGLVCTEELLEKQVTAMVNQGKEERIMAAIKSKLVSGKQLSDLIAYVNRM